MVWGWGFVVGGWGGMVVRNQTGGVVNVNVVKGCDGGGGGVWGSVGVSEGVR